MYSCRLRTAWNSAAGRDVSRVSAELLSIRKNQVLRNALSLCKDPPARRQARADAFEILALNLSSTIALDLAQELKDAAPARTADFGAISPNSAGSKQTRTERGGDMKVSPSCAACRGCNFASSMPYCCRSTRV